MSSKYFIFSWYCIWEYYSLISIIPTSECISILSCYWLCINCCIIILCNIWNCTSSIRIKFDCILINCPCSCNCCVFSWHWIWNIFIPMYCISNLCPTWFINSWCTRIIISCMYYIIISTFRIYKSDFITINRPISIDSCIFSWHWIWNWFIPTGKCISSLCWISWSRYSCIIILSNWGNCCSTVCIKCYCILVDIPLSCNCSILSRHCWRDSLIPTRKCISSLCWIDWFCHLCFIFISNITYCSSTICIKCNCICISSIIYLYYSTSISINSCLITSNSST